MSDFSNEGALTGYLELLARRPELFRNRLRGGIDILTDPQEIASAQAEAGRLRASRGMSTCDLRAGLLASDPYMTIVRDAVRFPDGTHGLYNRIVETSPVAVLPILDGRPVVIRVFRHGLRDWSIEFPRGAAEGAETGEEAAQRELHEEIGARAKTLTGLGAFTPGGSSLSIHARLYLAEIDKIGASDTGEGIIEVRAVAVKELERMIAEGDIIDGFSMALFVRARLKELI